MEQFIELLRTDNVLIIFAILLMVLFIGFLILLIRTANLNKRYREFMLKLGKGKNIEENGDIPMWKNKGKSISCTKKGTILVPFYYILHKILIASLFRRHFSCSFR